MKLPALSADDPKIETCRLVKKEHCSVFDIYWITIYENYNFFVKAQHVYNTNGKLVKKI